MHVVRASLRFAEVKHSPLKVSNSGLYTSKGFILRAEVKPSLKAVSIAKDFNKRAS